MCSVCCTIEKNQSTPNLYRYIFIGYTRDARRQWAERRVHERVVMALCESIVYGGVGSSSLIVIARWIRPDIYIPKIYYIYSYIHNTLVHFSTYTARSRSMLYLHMYIYISYTYMVCIIFTCIHKQGMILNELLKYE